MSGAWSIPWKRACGLDIVAKDRPADAVRIDVIEIQMQLRDHPDIGAALPVDRDQRLDGDLKGISDPDHPGIDGAGGHGTRSKGVRDRRTSDKACCIESCHPSSTNAGEIRYRRSDRRYPDRSRTWW